MKPTLRPENALPRTRRRCLGPGKAHWFKSCGAWNRFCPRHERALVGQKDEPTAAPRMNRAEMVPRSRASGVQLEDET